VLVGSLMGTGAAVAVRYTGRALTRRSAEHKARRRAHGREVGA
jgi:hypothetical protein